MTMTIPFASSLRKIGGRRSTNSSTLSTRAQAFRAPLWEYLSYVSVQQHLQAYLDAETIMAHSSRRHNGEHIECPPGASFEAISSLPSVRVLPIHKRLAETHANNRAECGICCERLVDGVALTRLPCGHVFHITCGVKWLEESCTCPECRYELPTKDPVYEIGRRERMKNRKTFACNCIPYSHHICFFDANDAALVRMASSSTVGPPRPAPVEELSHEGESSGDENDSTSLSAYESPDGETMNEATCCYIAQF